MTIAIKNFIEPDLFKKDVEIDRADLNFALMRQAGLFAYYAQQAADADLQVSKVEQLVDLIEAKLDRDFRAQATAKAEKITEAQIKNLIASHPEYIRRRTAYHEAVKVAAICKSAVEAFRNRREMLVQLAFNQREENKGELRVAEQSGPSARVTHQQSQISDAAQRIRDAVTRKP